MSSIALCMIVKNEEKYLPDCLRSVRGVADEIIVVDTGSTDKTKEIAKSFGAEIYDFEWRKDFSAARNFALSKANSDWILYLDADERLAEKSKNLVKKLAERKGKFGYFCNVVSPSDATGTPSVMKFIRFFARHPEAKFSGKVHEQIEPALRLLNYEILDSEIVIEHEGYNVDKTALRKKAERNLELLLLDYKTNPSSYNAFQIGQTYLMLEDEESATPYFREVLKKREVDDAHVAQTYRYLAAHELSAKNLDKALEYAENGLKLAPHSPLLHVVAANISIEKGDFEKAAFHAKQAYENNAAILNGKLSTKFDVLVNEANMILYGINLALVIGDRELFTFFYPKLGSVNLNDEDKLLLEFYNSIYVKGSAGEELLGKIKRIKNKIDIRVLINAVKYLSLDAEKTAKTLSEMFPENFELQFALGEKFFEPEKTRKLSGVFFERAHQLQPADLMTIWNLFNVYFAELNIAKLEKLYETAKKYHGNNAQLISVFEKIIVKLKSLPDGK